MGWIQRRLDILDKIKEIVLEAHKQEKVCDKIAIVSEICMKDGASRRTALEYLQTLQDAGVIEINNNDVFLNAEKASEIAAEEADKVLGKQEPVGEVDEKL